MGWLEKIHPYSKGEVHPRLVRKLKLLAEHPVELYRGIHVCDLCIEPPHLEKTFLANARAIDPSCSWAQWMFARSSNGEVRVSRSGIIFAAPVLVAHYIEEHGYLPPAEFLMAVEEASV